MVQVLYGDILPISDQIKRIIHASTAPSISELAYDLCMQLPLQVLLYAKAHRRPHLNDSGK
jgi:hypothetical protein